MAFLKKISVKYLVVLLLLLVLGVFTLFDAVYAQTYKITYDYYGVIETTVVVGQDQDGNDILGTEKVYTKKITANQKHYTYIVVTVTRANKPVDDHMLWMDSPQGVFFGTVGNAGKLKANALRTDKHGQAVFEYFPYEGKTTTPPGDVYFSVSDRDAAIFVEVPVRKRFIIELLKQSTPIEELDPFAGE